jgi:hypothetical protein
MFRVTNIAAAAVLALAVAALPLMLDRCAESCEAHPSSVASTPACHHATATGTHITKAPASCGHDHNGTAVTAVTAKSCAPTGRAFAFGAMAGSQLSIAPLVEADVRVDPHSPPDSSPPLAGRSLPLRV